MKLKATKSFHASGVGTVHEGSEFEVHDALGQEIADKGLASVIEGSTDTSAGADATARAAPKAEAPPLNKMEPAPVNKTGRTKRLPPEPTPSDRASSTEE